MDWIGRKYYSFETVWSLPFPIEDVWEIIHDVTHWPEWWEDVREVRVLEEGLEGGEGRLLAFRWRSVLPYSLRFQMRILKIERPHLLVGHSSGELAGEGTWTLAFADGRTVVHYFWKVRTTLFWMNLLFPVAAPLFRWNHNCTMRKGGSALRGLLEKRWAARNRR